MYVRTHCDCNYLILCNAVHVGASAVLSSKQCTETVQTRCGGSSCKAYTFEFALLWLFGSYLVSSVHRAECGDTNGKRQMCRGRVVGENRKIIALRTGSFLRRAVNNFNNGDSFSKVNCTSSYIAVLVSQYFWTVITHWDLSQPH